MMRLNRSGQRREVLVSTAAMLHHTTIGESGPVLVIVHGLFGSGRNWTSVARKLSGVFQVVLPDLRNHGESFWSNAHDYPAMAQDLAELIETLDAPVHLLGHSMGGKAAMVLALKRPDLVDRLIIADIAPVAYEHTQMPYLDAMRAVDLSRVARRSDAAAQLADRGVSPALQSFSTLLHPV